MDIYLRNHAYKYALEQTLASLFPGERPLYPESGPDGSASFLVSELFWDGEVNKFCSRAALSINGKLSEGRAECGCAAPPPESGPLRDRLGQKLVRLSFFNAAQPFLEKKPPWGAITGVRPAKLAAAYMEEHACGKAEAAQYLTEEYAVAPERALLCADAAAAGLRVGRGLRPGDISLYVGVPFCPSRCSYCSFVSQTVEKSMGLIEPYLAALGREIAAAGRLAAELGLSVDSVYIGGGTPTTLTPAQLDRLMAALSAGFDLSRCLEYTVEAGRPDTISGDKLKVMARRGATRISVNPQSMSDSVLAAIGRKHSGGDIIDSFGLARSLFDGAINMDLIAGLPADSAEGFARSLEAVIGLGPENITVHTLAAKRGSRLGLAEGAAPESEDVSEMIDFSISALRGAGYAPYYLYRQKYTAGGYENVGWCRSGFEGVYNIIMMEELHSVLSLGAGGVTKLVDAATGRIERRANKKYPKEYVESGGETVGERLSPADFRPGTKKHLLSSQ